MSRAHRYYIPGHIYHHTHRCHKRELLLKFSKDRTKKYEEIGDRPPKKYEEIGDRPRF